MIIDSCKETLDTLRIFYLTLTIINYHSPFTTLHPFTLPADVASEGVMGCEGYFSFIKKLKGETEAVGGIRAKVPSPVRYVAAVGVGAPAATANHP